jgi:hypothetical protein
MTKLLEKAVETVSQLPPEEQDEIARAMLRLAAQDDEAEEIPEEHLGHLLEGLRQSLRGEFAQDDQVEALFRRFGK